MNNNKKRGIDESIQKTVEGVESKFSLVSSREIKTWKAYLAVTFAAGFAAALIWGYYVSFYPPLKATEISQAILSARTSSETHKAGDVFPVEITLNTAGSGVVAVQAVFSWNRDNIEAVSADITQSAFRYEVKNTLDAVQGQGFLSLAEPHPGVTSAAAKVATITLRALRDVDEPTIILKFDSSAAVSDSAAILDNGQGTNILQRVVNMSRQSTGPSVDNTPGGTDADTGAESHDEFAIETLVGLTDTLVRASWSNGPEEGAGYLVERKEGTKDFSPVSEVGSGERSFVNRGLRPSKLYAFRICQTNEGGGKICTEGKQVKTLKKKKLFKPRLTAVAEGGKVILNWAPVYSSDFRLVLQKKVGKQKKYQTVSVIQSDSQTSYTDENVTPGTKHIYRIYVTAKGKKTEYSKGVTLTVP